MREASVYDGSAMNTIARLALVLSLALPFAACSCGGPSSPEELTSQAKNELHSGKHAAALTKFRKALETLKPGDTGYKEAKMGAIEARMYSDAEGAQKEFLDLAAAQPELIDARDYNYLGGVMANAKQFVPAIDVMHAGIVRYGKEEPKLAALLDKITKESVNDSAAQDKLKGLGYTGG